MKLKTPILGPDNTFEENRKIRFQEIIDDYLTDPDITPQDFYNELKSSIQSNIDYYQNHLDRSLNFMNTVSSQDSFIEKVQRGYDLWEENK